VHNNSFIFLAANWLKCFFLTSENASVNTNVFTLFTSFSPHNLGEFALESNRSYREMLLPVSHEEGLRMESGMMNSSSSSATSSRSSSFNLGEYSRSKGRSSRISSKSGSGIQVFRTCSAFPEYFARILDYKQMDLDATFYQMVTLCVHPSKVYKSAYYRKRKGNAVVIIKLGHMLTSYFT
jgi:hypothetical protein